MATKWKVVYGSGDLYSNQREKGALYQFHQVGQLECCRLIELHDVVLTSKSFQQL